MIYYNSGITRLMNISLSEPILSVVLYYVKFIISKIRGSPVSCITLFIFHALFKCKKVYSFSEKKPCLFLFIVKQCPMVSVNLDFRPTQKNLLCKGPSITFHVLIRFNQVSSSIWEKYIFPMLSYGCGHLGFLKNNTRETFQLSLLSNGLVV